MADYILSTNMNLPVPIVSQAPGPEWATLLNDCLTVIDTHDHSTGSGVPITPAGLNINSDLNINSNSLILVHRSNYQNLTSTLATTNTNSIYVVNGDLWYNDNANHQIRITQNGNVTGAAGNITGLVSPASASYVAISETFVWQSDVNTPANMDAASYILRNLTANSKGLTLSPPNSMAADYTLVLPSLPSSQKIMTLDASGNMSAPYTVDNSTITISSNVIGVPDHGITQVKQALKPFASGTGTAGQVVYSADVNYLVSGTPSPTAVPGLQVVLTTTGRPVMITLAPDGSTNDAAFLLYNDTGGGSASGNVLYHVDTVGTFVYRNFVQQSSAANDPSAGWPAGAFMYLANLPAGTHTITVYANNQAGRMKFFQVHLVAYEI